MNESQTRLTKIDPKLKENGWGVATDSYILTEVPITRGRISQSIKPRPMKADYILQYKDVLEYIAYQKRPETRAARVQNAQLYTGQQTPEQVAFIQYLVSVYVKAGIDELEADRLPKLMANKYGTILEGTNALGGIEQARGTFYDFQRSLYQQAI